MVLTMLVSANKPFFLWAIGGPKKQMNAYPFVLLVSKAVSLFGCNDVVSNLVSRNQELHTALRKSEKKVRRLAGQRERAIDGILKMVEMTDDLERALQEDLAWLEHEIWLEHTARWAAEEKLRDQEEARTRTYQSTHGYAVSLEEKAMMYEKMLS